MKKVLNKIVDFIKTNFALVIIAFLFLFLFVLDNVNLPIANNIINDFKVVATSFSPKTGIFDEDGEISYVSYVFNILNPNKEISFIKPTSNPEVLSDEFSLSYDYSGLVFSSLSGVVKTVGFSDNKKFIEISHGEGFVTRYEGVDILGVCKNETLKTNQAIATVKEGEVWKFSVFKNNELLKISEVKWEK